MYAYMSVCVSVNMHWLLLFKNDIKLCMIFLHFDFIVGKCSSLWFSFIGLQEKIQSLFYMTIFIVHENVGICFIYANIGD
jgi:hypothetical protein